MESFRKDSFNYYKATSEQVTLVSPFEEKDPKDFLTPSAYEKYEQFKSYVDSAPAIPIAKQFVAHKFVCKNTGPWLADKKSQYYGEDGVLHEINSFNNWVIQGLTKTDIILLTSVIVFVYNGYAQTMTGSIYKLGELLQHIKL